MGKCFYNACNHRSERGTCRFFKFPKSPNTRKKWVAAMCREDKKEPGNSAALCSCHFPFNSRWRTSLCKEKQTLPPKESPKRTARRMLKLDVPAGTESHTQSSEELQIKECSEVEHFDDCSLQFSAMSSSPWKVYPLPIQPPEVKSPQNSVLEEVESDLVQVNAVLSTPPVLRKRQVLQEELSRLAAEKEADKQKLELCYAERDMLQEKINELQVQRSACKNDFVFCAIEKVEYGLKCRELEETVQICKEQNHALEQKLSEISKDLCAAQALVKELEGHSSHCQIQINNLYKKCKLLKSELDSATVNLHSKVRDLELMMKVSEVIKRENETLKNKIVASSFSFSNVCSDENVSHYTGLPNVNTFYWLLSMIPDKLNYYLSANVQCMSRQDQLFMTLLKLRRNPSHTMLKDLFRVSKFTVSNVILTWISALHTVLVNGILKNVPSLKKIQKSMPQSFHLYPNCRFVIDCTEVRVEVPTLMSHHNMVFSNYKKYTSFKALVGVAPNGAVTYVSKLFPGSTSDKVIVQECGILELMEPGDSVMADKGFLINDILPNGVSLNVPPMKETPQFTHSQIFETLNIAKARIHVERRIQRIKLFQILNFIPHTLFPFASEMFQVCGALSNFGKPLIKEVEELMRFSES